MKYCDLNMRFDKPDIWRFTPPDEKVTKSFEQVMNEDKKFNKMKGEMKEQITKAISDPIDAATCEEEIGKNLDPILEHLNKSYFCSDTPNKDLLLKKANKNTLNKKLQGWCDQCNVNAPIIRKSLGTHIYYDKFKDVPAVVVCAGPSLGNAIWALRELQDKALIISTDTAFRSLRKRDIDPHFVNAHDANPQGARFFDGIETNAIGAFVNYISPFTIQAFTGRKLFYYVGDTNLPVYRTMATACDAEDRKDGSFLNARLTGGSSVAHTALYLAIAFGCNPITFVGLDLSYPDLTKSHFETDNPKNVSAQKLVDVWSINNEKVKTSLPFYSYKTVLEQMVPYLMMAFDKKIYTSSEDDRGRITGVVHEGVRPLPMREFIDRFAYKKREELGIIEEVYKQYVNY